MSNQTTAAARSGNPVTVLLTSDLFIFVLRVFLGGLFIYSSVHKIQSPHEFAIAIRGYKILPVELTNLFALVVAWSEVLAGMMLLLGIMTKRAAAAIFILLLMFDVAILTTVIRGIAIDCGCFSSEGGHQTNYELVIRNLFLMAAAAMVMIFDRGFWSVSKAFAKKP